MSSLYDTLRLWSINTGSYFMVKQKRSRQNKHCTLDSVNIGNVRKIVRLPRYGLLSGVFKGSCNKRSITNTNKDALISSNAWVLFYEEYLDLKEFGIYPNRSVVIPMVNEHKEGEIMKLDMHSSLSGYTDFYNLSCINSIYPISLTQNELVNFPVEGTDNLISNLNDILNKSKRGKLIKTDMIDHTLYHNDIFCIIINKTYGLDKKKVDDKEIECLSALLTGFCSIEALTQHSDLISELCNCVEKSIKDVNLVSNTALKNKEDIKLSDDNIQILIGTESNFTIQDLTIKNQEISTLDYDYYPYIDVDIMIDEFKSSSDKLLILHGNPGVGKSKLSSLISHRFGKEFKYNVIMFPGRHVMSSDAWSKIETAIESKSRDGYNTLVIIDDLDPVLLNREQPELANGNTFFNSLLTVLDGVISQGVKFVITTNHVIKKEDDSPLYRPGRLFDSILLKPLNLEEALALLKKYKVSAQRVAEFKKLKQTKYQQSFVAQFINDTNKNIKRSYYKGVNKQVTKTKASKIGF